MLLFQFLYEEKIAQFSSFSSDAFTELLPTGEHEKFFIELTNQMEEKKHFLAISSISFISISLLIILVVVSKADALFIQSHSLVKV